MRNFLVALGALAGTGLFLQCTSIKGLEMCQGADCPMEADATVDQVAPPPGCDITVEPKDSLECVVDSYAIFVSTEGGNSGNPGTRNSPVASINQAVKLAAQQGKPRVYVCGTGKIDEQVKLTNAAVSLYGGFSCSDWGYNDGADNKAHVAPSVRGAALTLTTLSETITIADLSFEAQPAVDPGESSVAAIANQSIVTFTRCDLMAGNGQDGQSGTPGDAASNYDNIDPSDSRMAGNGADKATGGAKQTCENNCHNGENSTGGSGGNGGHTNGSAPQATDGTAGTPSNGGGAAGTAQLTIGGSCSVGGQGNEGMTGTPGVTPASGGGGTVTPGFGALQPDGTWFPAWSGGGGAGGVGQGGGGGGGGYFGNDGNVGGGGGGGCGGCGGSPGTKAQAGGASIALISLKSQVSLNSCTLTTGQAGTGGNGAAGQPGQAGGNGGTQTSGGCQGGAGGKGGNGGASAGGAGGIVAGILWSGGQTPLPDASTTFTLGKKGTAGAEGAASNAGLDGKAATILQLVL